ncbi:helix-turn-helix domain-containing protein [Halomarina halobia]|uniref:Helix-turn-helix domain-containing protein n=1 Tax=Halomarina halobia TaxID=3033386 RepID=A0ABD6A4K7_9EURY|nr:helix-turn-helix domain-containing protein [Halomarina sp. PSR21]
MSTLVTGSLSADSFALAETFDAVPDLAFECERMAAAEGAPASLLWMRTARHPRLASALRNDPDVEETVVVVGRSARRLYRVWWRPDVTAKLDRLLRNDAILLKAWGNAAEWTFRLLYPSRDACSNAHEHNREYDLDYDVKRIQDGEEIQTLPSRGLTDAQLEALLIATRAGYFEVPRTANLEEVAAELGISHQALSERLRRAQETLVRETFFTDDAESDLEVERPRRA